MNGAGSPAAASTQRVLLVDDNPTLLRLLATRLVAEGYTVETAASGEQALTLARTFQPRLVITDLMMDGMDGMALLGHLHAADPGLPTILLTAHGSIRNAVTAIQQGAFGYLTKPPDSTELMSAVARALRLYVGPIETSGSGSDDDGWSGSILTRDPAMRGLLAHAQRAAMFDVSVLLQSESGTGKELLAHAIHRASKRSGHPFVAVNCSAVPEELLESELFGHAKGSFTGAAHEHKGLFEAARGGVLFLDEIGDMPLTAQAKVLRAIQEKEIRSVGSTQTMAVDVRIIAATHHNLIEDVAQHRFREDLFYRLNVIALKIPSLRERRVDIPLLARHFLEQFLSDHGIDDRKRFAPEALGVLTAQSWPGNVRQLRNLVERVIVLSPFSVITAGLVSNALQTVEEDLPSLADSRRRSERKYLVQILEMTNGNVTRAAQLAQRNRTEFYKILNRHRIDPHVFRTT